MTAPPPDAVAAAVVAARTWRVFASVSLAQWALESAWGRVATGKFNFFGIKATGLQAAVTCFTHEEVGGRLVPERCRFRSFASVAAAFDAHAKLIATDHRYAGAMAAPDVTGFVDAMGPVYATDPHYAAKVLDLIHVEGFARFDTRPA